MTDQTRLIEMLTAQNERLHKMLVLQGKQLSEQAKQLAEQSKLLTEQSARIEALLEKVEELSDKKKDSHNSSKPPSSDGYNRKPAPKSLKKKSGRSVGGQKGHKGSSLKIEREPDRTVQHLPEGCQNCPYREQCRMKIENRRYEYDLNIEVILTEHQQMSCCCPVQNKKKLQGAFPAHIKGTKQYGKTVSAFVASLSTVGMMGTDRIHSLMKSVFGIPMSTGTIQNKLNILSEAVSTSVEKIKQRVQELKLLHCDETGLRVEGSLHWLHCACDSSWSYFEIHKKRGHEAMDEMGILPNYHNLMLHDFWRSYLLYDEAQHAFCVAHILRELIYEQENSSQEWAGHLKDLLVEILHKRHELEQMKKTEFEPQQLESYLSQYDRLLSQGLALNPVPERKHKKGRTGKGKTRALLERLRDYKQQILMFAKDWSVPFSNNEAERSIRFSKVKQKVSGSFRTKDGADSYAAVMTYISSAAKHGVQFFDAVKAAFRGDALNLVESWG